MVEPSEVSVFTGSRPSPLRPSGSRSRLSRCATSLKNGKTYRPYLNRNLDNSSGE